MIKKAAVFLICIMFATAVFPAGGIRNYAFASAEILTLYELDADTEIKIGEVFASSMLKASGEAEVDVVDGGDGTVSLRLTDRINNFDGVDILTDALKKDNVFMPGTYTITVKGRVEQGEDVNRSRLLLSMSDSPWGELIPRVTPGSDGSFELVYSKEYSEEELETVGYNFRIQTPPAILTGFIIDNIIITLKEAEDNTVNEIFTFGFDDEDREGDLFSVALSSETEWINESGVGMESDTALKITHIEGKSYTSYENAVRLTFSQPLPAGGIYNVSAWFYAPSAENKGKGTLTGPGIVLNDDYAGFTGVSKFPVDFGTLPVDEWKELNVTLPVRETPLKSIDFRLVINDADKHADTWLLDNIVISQIGGLRLDSIPKWDITLDSIKDAYSDYFMIGNIMEPNQIEDSETTDMFKHHYSTVTYENAMKPKTLTAAKDEYNFENTDKMADWADDNGIMVHGHTLVWHSQSADWLTQNEDSTPLTRREAEANLKSYIETVAGRYKGRMMSWDVVNEAFKTSVSNVPANWRDALRKNESGAEGSPWYQAYENGADKSKGEDGSDYIYDAFVLTRLTDSAAKLYYNDFNETEKGKYEAIAKMAEELNEKWKADPRNTQQDRLLIEGIGMQAHYWTSDLKVSNVDAAIKRFIKTGAEISVTELDIPHGDYKTYNQRTAPPVKEEEQLQAELYGQLFKTLIKHADSIERVTFWGKADSHSWRYEGYPLLFDKVFAPKEAFWAVVGAASE